MKVASNTLIIERFVESDISPQYIAWLNNPELMRYSEQRHKSHSQQSCINYLFSFEETSNYFLSIKSIMSGELLGTMSVYIDKNNSVADMGILVGKEYSNKGLGTQVWSLMQNHLLNVLSIRKITAGTLRCNIGMLSIMKKNGMISDGLRQAQYIVDGQPVDIIYMAKFK